MITLGFLVFTIAFIILGTTKFKLHPFLTLLLAAILMGFLGGLSPADVMAKLTEGFGNTLKSIGIVIGSAPEKPLRPIIFAFALDVTPPTIGATTVSYVFAWNQTFSAISPLVGGFLADAFGVRYAMYFIAALTLTAALVACLVKGLSHSVNLKACEE